MSAICSLENMSPEYPLITWARENYAKPEQDFIDVGAHVGTWTLAFAKHVKRVFAFEPNRKPFALLCAGVALNQLSNVYPWPGALGSTNGVAGLKHVSSDGGGNKIVPINEADERVPISKLDGLDGLYSYNPSLVKIDVEGYELEVLRGMEKVLTRARPHIIFEVNPGQETLERDITNWLAGINYAVIKISMYENMRLAHPK